MPPRKNITQEGSDEPQVPKMTSKRTLTPEQLSNLARARQKAQELRRKAREEKMDDATREVVQEEIKKKTTRKKKEPEPEPEPEPDLEPEEYLQPEVQPPNEPDPMPPSIEPPEISESANPLAKTIKQKKKIIFEDSDSDMEQGSEPIIVVRKKTVKKVPEPEPVPEPKPQPVFYREAPMRPINPYQRHNADIYRR